MRAQAQRWTLRLLVVALLTSAPLSVSFPSTATTSPDCSAVAAKLTALGLTAHDRVSSDDVAYRMWSGTVASWDGVPLMVDLTVASGGVCNVPLISLNHGWGRDRTDYESDSAAGDGPALERVVRRAQFCGADLRQSWVRTFLRQGGIE
jgi:hypothetical protein